MSKPSNIGMTAEQVATRMIRERASGNWRPWRWHDTPKGTGGQDWLGEVRRVAENGIFTVLIRPVPTPWGLVEHLAISTGGGPTPLWPEKQRIKDTLLGRPRVAVEVFPAHEDIVDGAPMTHLWVLPPEVILPFGLHLKWNGEQEPKEGAE